MSETLTFTNANGEAVTFAVANGYYGRALNGRSMPPVEIQADEAVELPGVVFRGVQIRPRIQSYVCRYLSTSRAAVRAGLADLAEILNPLLGEGTLSLTNEAAVTRQIAAVYFAGLDDADEGTVTTQPLVLQFHHADPFWYDPSDTATSFASGETPGLFFPIGPQVRLASSTVYGQPTVTNSGSIDAYPVWTITGPGTDLVLTNDTTGETLSVGYTLNAGDVIVIDTRPGAGVTAVTDSAGTNLYQYLTGSLWALVPGANSITIGLSGATSASSVQLAYRRGFIAA